VQFLSKAPLENIEASNENAYVVFDAGAGKLEWSVLIKGFQFQKALMQQHFNENYMESDKYPKAFFKGKVDNLSSLNLSKDGEYNVSVNGEMTIHGVTKPFSTRGVIRVKGSQISASSSFDITVADYQIEVPKVVRDNIAKIVRVTVQTGLAPLQ
jgi:polyisoprenoid-binding protein YceI